MPREWNIPAPVPLPPGRRGRPRVPRHTVQPQLEVRLRIQSRTRFAYRRGTVLRSAFVPIVPNEAVPRQQRRPVQQAPVGRDADEALFDDIPLGERRELMPPTTLLALKRRLLRGAARLGLVVSFDAHTPGVVGVTTRAASWRADSC